MHLFNAFSYNTKFLMLQSHSLLTAYFDFCSDRLVDRQAIQRPYINIRAIEAKSCVWEVNMNR